MACGICLQRDGDPNRVICQARCAYGPVAPIGINAGLDALVITASNAVPLITARRDIAAVAYGTMWGAFTAGNDVVFLGSVGDMTAVATASNNIGTVMTYGAFGGTLTAGGACPVVPTTPESVAACGVIHSVQAKSDLGGSIETGKRDRSNYVGFFGRPRRRQVDSRPSWLAVD